MVGWLISCFPLPCFVLFWLCFEFVWVFFVCVVLFLLLVLFVCFAEIFYFRYSMGSHRNSQKKTKETNKQATTTTKPHYPMSPHSVFGIFVQSQRPFPMWPVSGGYNQVLTVSTASEDCHSLSTAFPRHRSPLWPYGKGVSLDNVGDAWLTVNTSECLACQPILLCEVESHLRLESSGF